MNAFVFPGQGAQFVGMAEKFDSASAVVSDLFEEANDILGYDLQLLMTTGTAEELKQTHVTQPALYVHSMISLRVAEEEVSIDCAAGHSLGEFSALAAASVFDFATGLELVKIRSGAMKTACDSVPGTMAAVLGLEDDQIEAVCEEVTGVVVAANYNSPGQVVISGEIGAVEAASLQLRELGARKVIPLAVGGAFHSPLMEPARSELAQKIQSIEFRKPSCPIYQNVVAAPVTNPQDIQANLISQLTSPVRWAQTMKSMLADGVTNIFEVGGNGKVLSGLFKRIDRNLVLKAM